MVLVRSESTPLANQKQSSVGGQCNNARSQDYGTVSWSWWIKPVDQAAVGGASADVKFIASASDSATRFTTNSGCENVGILNSSRLVSNILVTAADEASGRYTLQSRFVVAQCVSWGTSTFHGGYTHELFREGGKSAIVAAALRQPVHPESRAG
jgi:hypothetical protein